MSIYDVDPLDLVYRKIIDDDNAMRLIGAKDSVFKYHVPEEFRELPPIVRIHPISEIPTEYADNEQLAWDVILQIDVWDTSNPREIAMAINKAMKKINFKQSTPTFEFDPDTYLIRDGRRYRGVLILNEKEQ